MTSQGFLPVRQLVLVDLLAMILGTRPGQRAIVAVDGSDGVGKSHLVAELVALAPHVAGRQVLSVSVDGFHRPRAQRHARGSTSPEGFYHDSYDYEALRAKVLTPFRAGREITTAVFDVRRDEPVYPDPVEPGTDAVLLLEGIFLRRPELAVEWDASVLVSAPESITVARGNARFSADPAVSDPEHPANQRYVVGQRLYRQQARLYPPTWIVDNTDLHRPELIVPDPDAPQWFEEP